MKGAFLQKRFSLNVGHALMLYKILTDQICPNLLEMQFKFIIKNDEKKELEWNGASGEVVLIA
ncbi:CLUMA_CG007267, isoform A [Clunio marinus]|uniref:CLUMA_CG007267, isoform A n=1 Tax=Clunio marinus TaxID=568069 RepID=A0A1J1I0L3_9DIPT|nr:CLUMA_CG007267, isoform A [Clunio marinus]